MSDQNIPIIQNVSKIISTNYPRTNQQHIIESSIDKSFFETYHPINNYESDNFLEFRCPPSVGLYTDLSQIYLEFKLKILVERKQAVNIWTNHEKAKAGDWFDIVNLAGYSIFKHLSVSFNGTQIVNDPLHAYTSYIKLLTSFPFEDIGKAGRLYHLEHYKSIKEVLNDDAHFTGLDVSDPIAIRLQKLRTHGINIRIPLIADICQTSMYLLDHIQLSIKLTLHPNAFVFFTAQEEADIAQPTPKKYSYKLSNIKLDIQKLKPSDNSYNALMKSLLPANNITPFVNYLYTSKLIRTYHMSNNISEFSIETPFSSTIPERIYLTFLKYESFNTKDFKTNGLYLSHLNLSNIFITLNGTTLYNISADFVNHNVSELYHNTLFCLGKDHLLTFDNFIEGSTLLAFNLTNFDPIADIRTPTFGSLRIILTFSTVLAQNAILILMGDALSSMAINFKREIFLNRN